MEKNYVIFVNKKLCFVNFLDLDFEFLKLIGLWLDLDWVLKMQDWIRMAKSDSPFISGLETRLETDTKFRDSITDLH